MNLSKFAQAALFTVIVPTFIACGGVEGEESSEDSITLTNPTAPMYPTLPPINLCAGVPNLVTVAPTASVYSSSSIRVCHGVSNSGGAAWIGEAAGNGSIERDGLVSYFYNLPVQNLAAGASLTSCRVLAKPQGFLRFGTDANVTIGECVETIEVDSSIAIDPDANLDSSTSNNDCRTSDNARSTSISYVRSGCPW